MKFSFKAKTIRKTHSEVQFKGKNGNLEGEKET
jgi:hypothetical protein